MEITKIKSDGHRTCVVYSQGTANGFREVKFTSTSKHTDRYMFLIGRLLFDVQMLLLLNQDYMDSTIITQIDIKETDDKGLGASVTLEKRIDGLKDAFVYKSPMVYEDGDMTTLMRDHVREIMEQAEDYVKRNNEDKQIDMFAPNGPLDRLDAMDDKNANTPDILEQAAARFNADPNNAKLQVMASVAPSTKKQTPDAKLGPNKEAAQKLQAGAIKSSRPQPQLTAKVVNMKSA